MKDGGNGEKKIYIIFNWPCMQISVTGQKLLPFEGF